jgi:hypothetical protein
MNYMPVEEWNVSGTSDHEHMPDTSLRAAYRSVRAHISPLPLLARAGLLVLVTGVLIDLLGPVLGAGHRAHHTPTLHLGHLVAIAGMSTTLAGVVIDGARQHHRRRAAHNQSKEKTDAIR